jgi:large subunit GTPase 1
MPTHPPHTPTPSQADLANRDFTAEKASDAVIVSGPSVAHVSTPDTRSPAERAAAEAAAARLLRLPRRPAWTPSTPAHELDAAERAAFIEWRRGLAVLEEQAGTTLTPFEKNLEVWRQLWRVVERSHVVAQVVDARDPLRYYCADLAALAAEAGAGGCGAGSLLLLNKADLLPAAARTAWADWFDENLPGVEYVWWSAKAADEAAAAAAAAEKAAELGIESDGSGGGAAAQLSTDNSDPRTAVVGVAGLLDRLQGAAQARADALAFGGESSSSGGEGDEEEDCGRAAATSPPSSSGAASPSLARPRHPPPRPTAGLTGFPNVGKSSTLNALFGRKKAAVAPTPGRTKHFQTLDVPGRDLTLADCPGLVLPRLADSKADMVAAGVVPIDRLTDVRAPVGVVAARVGRAGLCAVYGVALPSAHPSSPPTAAELLRAVALSRGWVVQAALPDEARAGRLILRDFCAGRLPYFEWPPGMEKDERVVDGSGGGPPTPAPVSQPTTSVAVDPIADLEGLSLEELEALGGGGGGGGAPAQATAASAAAARRPDYKFHRRPPRTKGRRGQAVDGEGEPAWDGGALRTGKKGGLVRTAGGGAR